jgi:hypothetical protein
MILRLLIAFILIGATSALAGPGFARNALSKAGELVD